jgi:hypothetical protein
MPEGRDVILLLMRDNLLVGNEWDVSSIKRIHLPPQPCHLRQPQGYRGDSVVAKTQPIGVK